MGLEGRPRAANRRFIGARLGLGPGRWSPLHRCPLGFHAPTKMYEVIHFGVSVRGKGQGRLRGKRCFVVRPRSQEECHHIKLDKAISAAGSCWLPTLSAARRRRRKLDAANRASLSTRFATIFLIARILMNNSNVDISNPKVWFKVPKLGFIRVDMFFYRFFKFSSYDKCSCNSYIKSKYV